MRSHHSIRVIAALVLASVAQLAHAVPAGAPQEFVVGVGGFAGPSYSVRLEDNKLYCTTGRRRDAKVVMEAQPTETEWAVLRAELDRLGVWQWKVLYPNPSGAHDGTSWYVSIKYRDAKVVSEGRNNYPDARGEPDDSPKGSPAFRRFLAAVSKITKGCPL